MSMSSSDFNDDEKLKAAFTRISAMLKEKFAATLDIKLKELNMTRDDLHKMHANYPEVARVISMLDELEKETMSVHDKLLAAGSEIVEPAELSTKTKAKIALAIAANNNIVRNSGNISDGKDIKKFLELFKEAADLFTEFDKVLKSKKNLASFQELSLEGKGSQKLIELAEKIDSIIKTPEIVNKLDAPRYKIFSERLRVFKSINSKSVKMYELLADTKRIIEDNLKYCRTQCVKMQGSVRDLKALIHAKPAIVAPAGQGPAVKSPGIVGTFGASAANAAKAAPKPAVAQDKKAGGK